jgi:hypothetical protein
MPHDHVCGSPECQGRRWTCERPGCLMSTFMSTCPQCDPKSYPSIHTPRERPETLVLLR